MTSPSYSAIHPNKAADIVPRQRRRSWETIWHAEQLTGDSCRVPNCQCEWLEKPHSRTPKCGWHGDTLVRSPKEQGNDPQKCADCRREGAPWK